MITSEGVPIFRLNRVFRALAPDKTFFSTEKYLYFFLFLHENMFWALLRSWFYSCCSVSESLGVEFSVLIWPLALLGGLVSWSCRFCKWILKSCSELGTLPGGLSAGVCGVWGVLLGAGGAKYVSSPRDEIWSEFGDVIIIGCGTEVWGFVFTAAFIFEDRVSSSPPSPLGLILWLSSNFNPAIPLIPGMLLRSRLILLLLVWSFLLYCLMFSKSIA